jgi:hypothetical protein
VRRTWYVTGAPFRRRADVQHEMSGCLSLERLR